MDAWYFCCRLLVIHQLFTKCNDDKYTAKGGNCPILESARHTQATGHEYNVG